MTDETLSELEDRLLKAIQSVQKQECIFSPEDLPFKNISKKPSMLACTGNPSYSGGRSRRICEFKANPGKVSLRLFLKK
jgi:hypothetical protein